MRKFLIASHYTMADGLKDTVRFFTGAENLDSISAYVDGTALADQIAQWTAGLEPGDEAVIFTDIMGGSVNQALTALASDKVHVITGMNLPLVVELVLAPQDQPLDPEQIAKTVEGARSQLVYMNQTKADVDEEDE